VKSLWWVAATSLSAAINFRFQHQYLYSSQVQQMNTQTEIAIEFSSADVDSARDLLAFELALVGGGDIVVGSY
jgi:hypothetical protein